MSKKLITLSVCLIATTLVLGQKKDSLQTFNSQETNLSDVIVTANKIEQKQNSTGKLVNVLTQMQLQAYAGRSLSQVLNEQVGLSLPGALSNAGTVPTLYMRGASSGRTLILIDGAPVGDPSMISNEFDLNLVPLQQIERIEILRGAQSTIYGSDAIGGVINIITKNSATKKITGALSYGTHQSMNSNIQYNHQWRKWNYLIGFENQNTEGFSAAQDKLNKGDFDKDGYQNNSWFINVNRNLGVRWKMHVYTKKTKYTSDIDYGGFKDDKDNYFNNATSLSGITLQYKKEQKIVKLQYQYTTQDRSYRNDSADKTYLIFEDNRYKGKSHFADVFFSTPISNQIQWIIGSDFRFGSYQQTYNSISVYGPYTDNFKDTFQFQNALYTSMIFSSLSKKWLLEIGGRYNHHSRYGNHSTYTISPSYGIHEKLRAIGSVSTGFKSPSLYQLSYNDQLKAEASINGELGLEWKDTHTLARVVYYQRVIDNGIDYNYLDYNFFNYIRQKVNGIEIEAKQKIGKYHSFSFNYTYLNGEETNQNRLTVSDTITYSYLLKRPKHSLNLQWNYKKDKWSTSITARYISNRFDVGGFAFPDVELGDYTLFNAHIQYNLTNRLSFFANGQNLLTQKFQEIYGYNTIGNTYTIGIRFL